MPITISGSGTITGLTTGGLPDGSIAAADIAAGVVPTALSNAEDGTGTNFEFNSGFGSNGVVYGVRAWINFDGSGTPGTGRANGNMDAVTDNGVGDYTCNFTNDMPDANYVAFGSMIGSSNTDATNGFINAGLNAATGTHTTAAFRFLTLHVSNGQTDYNQVQIAVIR